jgi:hypothetical protein
MRGYIEGLAGTKIPDDRLVKPKNRRYITKHNGPDWTCKSMDRCPTYGLCKACMGSGPSGRHYALPDMQDQG